MPRAGEDGRIVGQVDRLREGEPVEYLSKTHGRWVSAFVERVHSDGSVSLDIKPRADPSRVRRRAWRVGERVEYHSRSRGGWISATVEQVHSDGSLTLDFGGDDDEETGAVTTPNPLRAERVRGVAPLTLETEDTTPLMGDGWSPRTK